MGGENNYELSRSDDEEEVVFTPAEHCEESELERRKGQVVLFSGCTMNVTVSILLFMHSWSTMNGGPGLGIDLNHVLIAYSAAMGLIFRWAYPPKKDKK